jgi:NADPH:quinone reductase-like Zn-dependent oxidoreductase
VVACTSGTPEKLARCRELGADLAISYRDEDFTKAVLDFTGGHGADVILDVMGAPYLAPNLAALATWGRLMVLSVRGGGRGEIDLGLLMAKRGSIFAATLRARPPDEKAEVVAATRQHVWPLISAGQIAPVIWQVLPMAEAAQAHRLIESGAHIGKILLAN